MGLILDFCVLYIYYLQEHFARVKKIGIKKVLVSVGINCVV